jgi:glutamate-1-semialdehyde 2,1-aminomutase
VKYPDAMSTSAQIYERALRVLPGGSTRQTVYRRPYPIYARSGHGPWIVDEDGVERLDFINNYTSLIHGHAHPAVVDAVVKQVRLGASFAAPTIEEVRLAEVICERLPSAERVRFTNSGSEAVMLALKAARAYTGRPKIAKCEGAYHGAYDPVEVSLSPTPDEWGDSDPIPHVSVKGTPRGVVDDVVVLPFNDPAAAERIITAHASGLAAIIVDPLPRRVGLVPATREFLDTLRALTKRYGIVFIFDEVISFRIGFRGAQGAFGVMPDLTTLGKIVGGGFPVGAVAGSYELLAVTDPRKPRPELPHSGTFNGNPVTMVAGLATLSLLDRQAFAALDDLGERVRGGLRAALTSAGVEGSVTGLASLFVIHLGRVEPRDYRSGLPTPEAGARLEALFVHLLSSGFLFTPDGFGALSTVLTGSDVDVFADAVAAGLRATKEATSVAKR